MVPLRFTEPRQLHRILGPAAQHICELGTDILNDIIRPDFYGPTGYSLKQLAPAAGALWRTDGATGADTYAWIDAARQGDQTAWGTLTDYEDDVRALRALRQAITQITNPDQLCNYHSPPPTPHVEAHSVRTPAGYEIRFRSSQPPQHR